MQTDEPPPSGGHGDETFDPRAHRPSARTLALTGLGVGVVIVAVTLAGVIPRLHARATLRADRARREHAVARVVVTHPTRAPASAGSVTLPGSILPVQETFIYSRTSGYVRAYRVDLGDAVREGQVLAEIDTPELDQELRQAQASGAQARANIQQSRAQLDLARVESARYATLGDAGFVSQQEAFQYQSRFGVQQAGLQASQAALAMAEANVRRLQELKTFATVRAPFDGVVTSRTVEVGQLVTAGTSAGQAIFRVSKTDVVRVFVNVPQLYAPSVRVGGEATLRLRELPTRTFRGTVTRTAHALDVATRTLSTEVRVPNADGALLAGMYTQVTLPIERAGGALMIPATALVAGAEGTRVAVVEGGAIHWRAVQVDSDLGDRVLVASGLRESDEVVVTPSDRLNEGMRVRGEPARAANPS
jgi:RND family efflux transporter MFP subunit